MENKTKREKGITLIVLVVTIIVLIILSGVTIATLTGHNGIINKAQNAKDDTQYSQWEEQIDIAIIDAESKHRNPTMDEIIEELKNKHIIDNDSQVNEETGTLKDYEKATIIGTKTYGKGVIQTLISLSDGSGLKTTTEEYGESSLQMKHSAMSMVELVLQMNQLKIYIKKFMINI